jgi:hypothetical protein
MMKIGILLFVHLFLPFWDILQGIITCQINLMDILSNLVEDCSGLISALWLFIFELPFVEKFADLHYCYIKILKQILHSGTSKVDRIAYITLMHNSPL